MRERPAGEADRVDGGAQVARDEREVGRLDRDVGAGADREPEVGLGERGRVVDRRRRPSRRRCPSRLQPLDLGDLPLRVDLGERRARSRPRRRPRSAALGRVAGEQDRRRARAPSARATASALVGLTVSRTSSVARGTPSQATSIAPASRPTATSWPVDDARRRRARARCGSPRRPAARRPRRGPRARPPARSDARTPPRPRRRAAAPRRASRRSASATPASSSLPSVTVPVLSSTIVSIRRVCSSTCGPLIRMPSCAPRPGADHQRRSASRGRARTGRR